MPPSVPTKEEGIASQQGPKETKEQAESGINRPSRGTVHISEQSVQGHPHSSTATMQGSVLGHLSEKEKDDGRIVVVASSSRNIVVKVRLAEDLNSGAGPQGEARWVEGTLVAQENIHHPSCATLEAASTLAEGSEERPTRIGKEERSDDGWLYRKDWISGEVLFRVQNSGQAKGDSPQEGDEIEVDVESAVVHSSGLSDDPSSLLPFSRLHVDLPTATSSFGRPPSTAITSSTLYPSNSPNSAALHAARAGHPADGAYASAAHTLPPLSSRSHRSLVPPIPDPFFLPPPFTPSHPYLHSLCLSAVSYLGEANLEAERQVQQFIESKAREMAGLQEQVRKEVEHIWTKYAEGPGKDEEVERRRSRSVSVSRRGSVRRETGGRPSMSSREDVGGNDLDLSTTPTPSGSRIGQGQVQGQPSDQPIVREAINQFQGGSLLSVSLAGKSYMPTGPSISPDRRAESRVSAEVDNDIDTLSQRVGVRDDQRAVAMSYVFNGLDEMEKRRQLSRSSQDRQSASRERTEEKARLDVRVAELQQEVQEQQQNHVHGKDSWIDEERNLAARYTGRRDLVQEGQRTSSSGNLSSGDEVSVKEGSAGAEVEGSMGVTEVKVSGEDKEGKTPRAGGAVHKDRPRVTFQENKPDRRKGKDRAGVEQTGEEQVPTSAEEVDEDNVFDFELEDAKPETNGSSTSDPSSQAVAPPRPKIKDMYEDVLSSTLAAGIPSHRAAHQRIKATGQNPYDFLRRRVSGQISGSATPSEDSLDGSDGYGAERSFLATSMPVNIVMPSTGRHAAGLPPLEPKTSLTDRKGLLVPGLRGAMRGRYGTPGSGSGSGSGSASAIGDAIGGSGSRSVNLGAEDDATPRASSGLNPMTSSTGSLMTSERTRRGSRSASVSREREKFLHDPGAVLELVGEGDDRDDDDEGIDNGNGDGQSLSGSRRGSLLNGNTSAASGQPGVGRGEGEGERERRRGQFMPPHILARQESAKNENVGWRSLVSD